jgi:predicted metal-dependent enzyme (double-stranded beta helix superfamily)
MFDVAQFIEDCKAVVAEYDTPHAIREVIQRAVDDPAALVQALGEPRWSGIDRLYVSDTLTILNIAWGPGLSFPPHNHNMWSVIGIYGGREDNTFYRTDETGLHQEGFRELVEGETIPLGPQAIHAVTNPLDKITAAIHIYGGDFFSRPRSEWDPASLEERPYDLEKNLALFEESNERLRRQRATS